MASIPRMSVLVVFLLCTLTTTIYGAAPTGCTYNAAGASMGLYTCDYSTVTKPVAMSGFSSPNPQRMKFYSVSGTMAANDFSSFSTFDTSTLDSNYAASLEIQCTAGSTVTLVAGSFAGLSYIQTLKFTNCELAAIPDNAFSDFQNLDYLLIDGGSIAGLSGYTLAGLNISKDSVPDPRGEVAIRNSAITGGIPDTFFENMTEIKAITLENVKITDISSTLFSTTTGVTQISLANNPITNISKTAFSNLNALSLLDFTGLDWYCTCEDLWFIPEFEKSGIDTKGGVICGAPSSYANRRGSAYYTDNCVTVDICGTTPGIAISNQCLTVYQLTSFGVLFVALVLSCIALGLVCYTRKQLADNKNKLKKKKNASWNKVQDALKRGGGAGQKPPANAAPPKGKGWV